MKELATSSVRWYEGCWNNCDKPAYLRDRLIVRGFNGPETITLITVTKYNLTEADTQQFRLSALTFTFPIGIWSSGSSKLLSDWLRVFLFFCCLFIFFNISSSAIAADRSSIAASYTCAVLDNNTVDVHMCIANQYKSKENGIP